MRSHALGQYVHQETPDELMRGQGHGLIRAGDLDPVIFAFEGQQMRRANAHPLTSDQRGKQT
jgi:hypothetical protein